MQFLGFIITGADKATAENEIKKVTACFLRACLNIILDRDPTPKISLFQGTGYFLLPMLLEDSNLKPMHREKMMSATIKKAYQSNISAKQCAFFQTMLRNFEPKKAGKPMKWSLINILNAILYVVKSGCQWRMLPSDFPPWQTVYYHFNKWSKNGVWEAINSKLTEEDRSRNGREPTPSAGIIDSQSVKTTEAGGPKGYDAGKKIKGRKRHIVVDTDGRIISATIHEADIQDRDGAKLVFPGMVDKYPRLKLIWADGGYAGKLVEWVKENTGYKLEIVKRTDDVKGFKVLPRRWVVERTFGWFNRFRRLSKDYEYLFVISESFIHIAMIAILLNRLAPA